MILTVLGCSGSVPGPGNPCSGYLVEHDGYRLLLDLGTGALGTLLGLLRPESVDTVDAVVLSHRHGDHMADLAALAYTQEKLPARTVPTRVIAPAGTARTVARAELLSFEDARDGGFALGPFGLRLARVHHSVETYAVRVGAGGASLTYTGDSGPCRELRDLARGSGLVLAEAALGPGEPADPARDAGPDEPADGWDRGRGGPGPHHLTARQAGELAELAGAGLLAVTHLRPWDDPVRSLAAAAGRFAGPTVLARPGLRLVPGRPTARSEPEDPEEET